MQAGLRKPCAKAAEECQSRADGSEISLAACKASRAAAGISSAMFAVDRTMSEYLPGLDRDAVPRLQTLLRPIYERMVHCFQFDTEPPDVRKLKDYSHWLATYPNPWNGPWQS